MYPLLFERHKKLLNTSLYETNAVIEMRTSLLIGLTSLLGLVHTASAEELTLEQKARQAVAFLEQGQKNTSEKLKYSFYEDAFAYKDKIVDIQLVVDGPYTKGIYLSIIDYIPLWGGSRMQFVDAAENKYGNVDYVFVFGKQKVLTGKEPVNKAYEKLLDEYLARKDPEKYFTRTVQRLTE